MQLSKPLQPYEKNVKMETRNLYLQNREREYKLNKEREVKKVVDKKWLLKIEY